MTNNSLLFGLIGFFLGGLLVSVVATTREPTAMPMTDSMGGMVASLDDKSGDEFDEAYLAGMIMHHESALAMAKLAETRAKHAEIKRLSGSIISSQQAEIDQMKAWQVDWGYDTTHGGMSH